MSGKVVKVVETMQESNNVSEEGCGSMVGRGGNGSMHHAIM